MSVTADNASVGVAHEEYYLVTLFRCGQLGLDAADGVGVVKAGEIEITVYLLNVADCLVGVSPAAQTDGVDSGIGYRLAAGLDKRGMSLLTSAPP